MKNRITKRDVFFFISGLMTLFFVEIIWDWDNHVKAFEEGMNAGYENFGATESAEVEAQN